MTRHTSKRPGDKTSASPGRQPPRPPAAKHPPVRKQAQSPAPAFRRPSAELAVLYGFHAVREILRSKNRKLLDIFATKAAAERLCPEIESAGLIAHIVESEDLARRLGANAVHQGVMVEARPLEPLDLSDIATRSGVILVLDQITDPHNVGAILRTAAAFGVDALVMTERHAPDMTGVVAKAASGGLEHVAIVSVVNLARALEQLGDMGYLRIGLDSEAATPFEEAPLARPLALVLGGEGKGMRRLTRENCDHLARLDMPGAIKSLNVSNACAVALTLAHMRLPRL
ncbi:23S rRNA (guanosine(2251)-2'-O)-methyltransferase RlmB [Methylocapsa aurea]|uniref:23S rRNA (guanosine(2251)-2'-O)-methyltransferase RlmB n=1 Tax=Methylocapsa aurea TaxID=663610 RepID=UPI00068AB0CA|nr:23S rRNA (guanosine(2251)-2'-O)-methyltransferase RlmB [Methylocapsa aurea]